MVERKKAAQTVRPRERRCGRGSFPKKSVIKNNVPVSIRRPIYNPLKNQSGSPPGFSREKDVRF
jgi:hypothetical protein